MPKTTYVQSWTAASGNNIRTTPNVTVSGVTIGNGLVLGLVTELKPSSTLRYTVTSVSTTVGTWVTRGVVQPTRANWIYSGSDAAPDYDAAVNIFVAIATATSGSIIVTVPETLVYSLHVSEWANLDNNFAHGGGLSRDYDAQSQTYATSTFWGTAASDSFRVSAAQDNVLVYSLAVNSDDSEEGTPHLFVGTGAFNSAYQTTFAKIGSSQLSGTAPSGATRLRALARYSTSGNASINGGSQAGLNYWPEIYGFSSAAGAHLWSMIALKGTSLADSSGTATLSSTADLTASEAPSYSLADAFIVQHPRVVLVDPTGSQSRAVPGALDISWLDAFNEMGSGKFRIPFTDPMATLSLERWFVRCYLGEVPVFGWIVETPAYTIGDSDAGEFIELSGRSNEAYLERAINPFMVQTFTGTTIGDIMAILISQSHTRGGLNLLTHSFNASVDSAGVAWTNTVVGFEVPIGTDYRTVLNRFRQMGVVAIVTHNLVLHLYQTYGTSRSVTLREGRHIKAPVAWQAPQRQLANVVYAFSDLNVLQYFIEGTGWDRREVYVRGPDGADMPVLGDIANAEYNRRLSAATAINVPIYHGLGDGDYEPYTDFYPGDTVSLHVPGKLNNSSQKVVGINIHAGAEAEYECSLDLSSFLPTPVHTIADTVYQLKTGSETS